MGFEQTNESDPGTQMQEEMNHLKDKFRGTLLGVAIGDVLGAPFEDRLDVDAGEFGRNAVQIRRLRYTDDTHMTLGLAQSLLETRGFDGQHMAHVFAANFENESWRGYGAGPPQVFNLIQAGVSWYEAARSLFGGSGSYGNGAAMRVAPVALFAYPDLNKVAQLARQTALVTHTHPLAMDGAVAQACVIAKVLGLARSSQTRLNALELLAEIECHLETSAFRKVFSTLKRLAAHVPALDVGVVRELGNGIEALRSVPTALYSFLRYPDSLPKALSFAIRLGGDTDTIGAMTGALVGAHLGEQAIPYEWTSQVEDGEDLRQLADSLFARSHDGEPAIREVEIA